MPPHIFHGLSDDPAGLEKQIGCLTGFFQMFEHQQNASRKHFSANKTIKSKAAAAQPFSSSYFTSGTKQHNNNGSVDGTYSSSRQQNAPKGFSPGPQRDSNALEPSRPSSHSKAVPRFSWYLEAQPKSSVDRQQCSRNSPSILDSSRSTATIREPPRKSFDASALRDSVRGSFTNDQPRPSLDGREAPGSTYEISRSAVYSYDPPRASLDGREISRHSYDPKRRDFCLDSSKDPVLEGLKESLRTLAKLREATHNFVESCEAPRTSVDWKDRLSFYQSSPGLAYDGREGPRSSSFDYKDAIRISQKLQETPRLSLDGREIPKSVLKLREALRSRLDGLECPIDDPRSREVKQASSKPLKQSGRQSATNSSSDSSSMDHLSRGNRPVPNVIARLMGLEDLPVQDPATKPLKSVQQQKPSKEAKLLQGLLQCKPQDSGPHAQPREGGLKKADIECQPGRPVSNAPDQQTRPLTQERRLRDEPKGTGRTIRHEVEEAQILSKGSLLNNNPEDLRLAEPIDAPRHAIQVMPASPRLEKNTPTVQSKPIEAPKEQHDSMVTILEESMETLREQRINGFQEEIEKRLRQLGLENSLKERKTLKQILEAMHRKGLLHPPQLKQTENLKEELELKWSHPNQEPLTKQVQQLPAEGHLVGKCQSMLGETDSLPSNRVQSPSQRAQSSTSGGQPLGESIVIIKPRINSTTGTRASQLSASSLPQRESPNLSEVQARSGKPRATHCDIEESSGSGTEVQSRVSTSTSNHPPRQRIVDGHVEEEIINVKLAERSSQRPCATRPKDALAGKQQSPTLSTVRSTSPSRKGSPPKRVAKNTAGMNKDGDGKMKESKGRAPKSPHTVSDPSSGSTNVKKSSLVTVKKSLSKSSNASLLGGGAARVAPAEEVTPRNKVQPIKNHRKIEKSRGQKPETARKADEKSSSKDSSTAFERGAADTMANADGSSKTNAAPAGEDNSGLVIEGCHNIQFCQKNRASVQSTTEENSQLSIDDGARTSAPEQIAELSIDQDLSNDIAGDGNQESNSPATSIDRFPEPKVAIPELERQDEEEQVRTPQRQLSASHQIDAVAKESEQCSPISVLDPHYDEDDSSPETMKKSESDSKVGLRNNEDAGYGDYTSSEDSSSVRALTWEEFATDYSEVESEKEPEPVAIQQERPAGKDIIQFADGERSRREFKYVQGIFSEAGLLVDEFDAVVKVWFSTGCGIEPGLYLRLEEEAERWVEEEEGWDALKRRLLFSCVNEILARRLISATIPHQISKLAGGKSLHIAGQELLLAVWDDLQRLQVCASEKQSSRTDRLYTLLERDLVEWTNPWSDSRAQISEVARDLEEMILRDLVGEVLDELLI